MVTSCFYGGCCDDKKSFESKKCQPLAQFSGWRNATLLHFSFSQVFTSNIHMADYLPVPVSGAQSKQSQQWFEVPTSQVIL